MRGRWCPFVVTVIVVLLIAGLSAALERKHAKPAEVRAAAEQGDAKAQFDLGIMYANGVRLPKDADEAAKWFHKAAEQEYIQAQYYLGTAYRNGRGVPKDPAESIKWYRRAAEQGYLPAQLNLGIAYAHGEGVQEDPVQAYLWLDLASHAVKEVEKVRNRLAAKMTPDQLVEAQKLSREWKPKTPDPKPNRASRSPAPSSPPEKERPAP